MLENRHALVGVEDDELERRKPCWGGLKGLAGARERAREIKVRAQRRTERAV